MNDCFEARGKQYWEKNSVKYVKTGRLLVAPGNGKVL